MCRTPARIRTKRKRLRPSAVPRTSLLLRSLVPFRANNAWYDIISSNSCLAASLCCSYLQRESMCHFMVTSFMPKGSSNLPASRSLWKLAECCIIRSKQRDFRLLIGQILEECKSLNDLIQLKAKKAICKNLIMLNLFWPLIFDVYLSLARGSYR